MTTFRISPHIVPRDDWVLMSYEVPMLMLLGIGAAAELGTVEEDTLLALSMLTLALLAGCIVFHLGDLVYHVWKKEEQDSGDESGSELPDKPEELDDVAVDVEGEDADGDTLSSEAGVEEDEPGFFAKVWDIFPALSARSLMGGSGEDEVPQGDDVVGPEHTEGS